MNYSYGSKSINMNILFMFCVGLFFLSPYINLGFFLHGGFLGVSIILLLNFKSLTPSLVSGFYMRSLLICAFIFAYSSLISIFYFAVIDSRVSSTLLSLLVYLLVGLVIFYSVIKDNQNHEYVCETVIKIFVVAMTLNSLIVVFEFMFPSFNYLLQSYLIQPSKVEYDGGLRFKGLASAGGANLSLAHATASILALVLYSKGKLNFVCTLLCFSLCAISIPFVGRTGVIILGVGLLSVGLMNLSSSRSREKLNGLWKTTTLS